MDDWQLLQDYSKRGSERAFRDLVARYLGLVHSAALRQINDPQVAEEVTQAVFILLARKATSFRQGVVLPGWLFRTTRFVAARAARSEWRRHQREREAFEMQQLQSPGTPTQNLSPLLDEALVRLNESERNALLLRFVQEQSLREVGQCLGLSEEAAKKRVSRALDRLRGFFVRRGFTVSAAVMASVFAHPSAQGATAEFASHVAAKSLAVAAASGPALPLLVRETLDAWRWTQWKISGGVASALAALACFWIVTATLVPVASGSSEHSNSRQPATASPLTNAGFSSAVMASTATRSKISVLHFRVVDQATGEPVIGAPLGINTVTSSDWKTRFDLSTGEDGSADISYPAAAGRLDVGVIASGWAPRFATWRTDTDPKFPTDYTMRVERRTNAMGGWLRDEKGQPVADAVVEVEFSMSDMAQEENPRERPGFLGSGPVARSDRRGWWSCALFKPAAKSVPGFRARHPHFALTQIISRTSTATEGSQAEALKQLWSGKLITTLERGIKLTGRVLSSEGNPIARAQIDHDPASSEPLHAESDRQGWFSIDGLPSGSFDFIVTAPGFAQDYFQAELKQGMEPVEVRLKPGGLLRLRVVDAEGNPVPDATVAWVGLAGSYQPGIDWQADSGPDGWVEWTSAPTDQMLNLCASRHPDFSMSRGTLAKADGDEHVIQLSRTLVVTGRVIDAGTGEVLRQEIKAFPGYGAGEYSWYRGATWRSTDGTFRVYFTEASGRPRFRVEAEGYTPFVSEWLEPGYSNNVDVVLQRTDSSKTVRGIVWRTDGQPAVGAQVALLSPEHVASLGRACFSDRARGDQWIVDTDVEGRFAFPEEPMARLVVAVCSNGIARVPVGDLKEEMEIRLQPWARIEGYIDPSALKRPVVRVRVDDLLALDSPRYLRLDSQTYYTQDIVEGRFAFEYLPAGCLCVWLDSGIVTNSQTPYHHPTWIKVTAGERTQVTIADTGCHVKGRFVANGIVNHEEGSPNEASPQTNLNNLHLPPKLIGLQNILKFKDSSYAILDSELTSDPLQSPHVLDAKRWISRFFDPGRLIIKADGNFESLNSIPPGTYRLRGKFQGIPFNQQIEVPSAPEPDFPPIAGGLDSETPAIDLGDIVVTPAGTGP